jgi:hypothetical protein
VIETIIALPTALAKIEFWYKNGLRWLGLQDSVSISGLVLEPFKFEIPPDEYGVVNNWIFENYLEHAWGTMEEKKKKFYDLADLIEEFEGRYK